MIILGAQAGIYSASQLMLHNHLNDNMGGILNEYSRYGAFRRPFRTGALAVHCDNDAEKTDATGMGLVLLKETRINKAQVGNYKISWQHKNADNATDVYSQFFVNGVPVGIAQHTVSSVYASKTHDYDIALAAGDLLQIWGDPSTDAVFVRSFRIYYDWRIEYFGDGTHNNLVTALPLSDADLLDFTEIL